MDATWRYIHSMKESDSGLDPAFEVPQVNYFDLSADHQFASDASLRYAF